MHNAIGNIIYNVDWSGDRSARKMDHQSTLLRWAGRGQATSMAGFLCLPCWTNNTAFSRTALYLSLHSKSSSSLASYSISALNRDVVLTSRATWPPKWRIATVAMLINDIHEINVRAATEPVYRYRALSPPAQLRAWIRGYLNLITHENLGAIYATWSAQQLFPSLYYYILALNT